MKHFYIRKAGILLAKSVFLLCGLRAIWMMLSLVEPGGVYPWWLVVLASVGAMSVGCCFLLGALIAWCTNLRGRTQRGHGPGKAGARPQDRPFPEAQRMSAPAKEPQPLGSTTGKREDVRICVRYGKEMQMVGRNAKYCLLCRGEVYRERARAYRASHHASANTGASPSAQKIRFCQRCGVEIKDARPQQKWCADCHKAVKAQQSRQSYIRRHEASPATKQLICQRCGQSFDVSSAGYARAKYCLACRPIVESEQRAASYERKKSARTFAGPYMTNSHPADIATRAAAKAQAGEDRLRLLSNVADWAGISYGQLMLKSPAEREALILAYKAAKGGTQR